METGATSPSQLLLDGMEALYSGVVCTKGSMALSFGLMDQGK